MVTQSRTPAAVRATGLAQMAIDVTDVVKTYPGNVTALQQLSFAVPDGSIFGLLGPNGAGKSTIVKILTTLTQPDSGTALVAGVDVVEQPQQVRRLIGYVSQQPAVDPNATGTENLMLQGQLYGMNGRVLRLRVNELLDSMELTGSAGRVVKTYSGGMKRKLDVAMGLVHKPRVLFLDEPTTGLDPEARTDLWQQIRQLAHSNGITILLTTHYLEEADQLADQVAIVDRGRVVVEGTPEQLKQEMHGDTIQIELDGERGEEAVAVLSQIGDAVRDVEVMGKELRARVERGATSLPRVLAALDSAGLSAISVTVARPTLDDVYLRYAGRTFATAQEEGFR